MIVEGRTERLILRPQELADAEQIQSLFPQWEIVRFLMNRVPWPYPPDGALCYIRDVALPRWSAKRRGTGRFARRGAGENYRVDFADQGRQGQPRLLAGSAMARARADERGLRVGERLLVRALSFGVLRVSKAVGNTASRRISEKQGMRLVGHGEKDYVSGHLPSEIWEITAEEWRAWKAAG